MGIMYINPQFPATLPSTPGLPTAGRPQATRASGRALRQRQRDTALRQQFLWGGRICTRWARRIGPLWTRHTGCQLPDPEEGDFGAIRHSAPMRVLARACGLLLHPPSGHRAEPPALPADSAGTLHTRCTLRVGGWGKCPYPWRARQRVARERRMGLHLRKGAAKK